MDRKEADLRCMEVWYINCYALFMGYLLMAVRGLGFLVITWSTVVLLGGFVSVLEKKDFWSLTIITLVLTPRVSADVGLKGKLKYIEYSIIGVSHAIYATLNPNGTNDTWARQLLAAVVWLCHLLVGPIVVCPLAALYMCGPLFSAGISAWRLIEHDYVAPKNEEAAHLQPALIVLYSLAMLQGLLFCYRFYSSFARKDLVNDVARAYKMNHIEEDVKEYLRETVIGCEKDPAFFKETNLATYAMGMIKSQKSENFLSGARILDALLEHPAEERTLTSQLISLVASSGPVLEKLLLALDSTSPYDETIRVIAANIVTHLASRIPLMQFPHGIQRIGSLIHISQQQFEDDCCASSLSADDYKKLTENGFVILRKLAADEDNCRTISNAQGLLSKVMAPVSSDLLHLIDHEAWSTAIVTESLQVMCRLMAAPGETGAQLRRQISSSKEVIHGMEEILKCCGCGEQVRILTIEILTQLPVGLGEEFPCGNKESRENFIKMLPSIFTDEAKEHPIRKLAGEALLKLSQSETNAAIILKANDHLVRDLRKILLDAAAKGTNRIMAAKTLKHLYIYYKENDEYLRALKETMEDVMPKILREILPPVVLNGNDTLAETRTHRQSSPLLGPADIEAQVLVSQDDGRSNNTSTCQQNDDMKLHMALLSLAAAIFDKFITQDHNLAQLVDKISPGDSPTSFANKLNELVRRKSQPTASCLSMMKNASNMVISMMKVKHSDSYLKEHFLVIFLQSLADACKTMSSLESFMILYSANRGTLKPYRTLASLLKEAEELLVTKEPKEQ
ncbi:uncharacterized protein [Aegilops tauschii subsp. strangulata]|uniref:Uncharacterized protein n=1 Tax=Aegilops tauschii subsp. strangulata TaxID=200361 RepID=A0A453T8Z4_AEGTS|nr:uncharacterized protein LOC109760929 [Aegilops tauschii subsp. strangulata]XP_045087066.1 uncharacterized protein LOC109760929 [Aegilops tauschii subsp. strangulata]